MRGMIDMIFGRDPEPNMAALRAKGPAETPPDRRADELRQIAARYRAIGDREMAAQYEGEADGVFPRMEAALFIHHVLEDLPLSGESDANHRRGNPAEKDPSPSSALSRDGFGASA